MFLWIWEWWDQMYRDGRGVNEVRVGAVGLRPLRHVIETVAVEEAASHVVAAWVVTEPCPLGPVLHRERTAAERLTRPTVDEPVARPHPVRKEGARRHVRHHVGEIHRPAAVGLAVGVAETIVGVGGPRVDVGGEHVQYAVSAHRARNARYL